MPLYPWFTELFGKISLENFLRVRNENAPAKMIYNARIYCFLSDVIEVEGRPERGSLPHFKRLVKS